VARYAIEQLCRLPCRVEIASEYRYRSPVVQKNALLVAISQSGETATLWPPCAWAASLGIWDARDLQRPRELAGARADLVMLTALALRSALPPPRPSHSAGRLEPAVDRTARHNGGDAERERSLVGQLIELPGMIEKTLQLNDTVHQLALHFADKQHALFLGRGPCTPSPWKARSNSRRSPTSTPKATPPASSSTARSRWSMPACRW